MQFWPIHRIGENSGAWAIATGISRISGRPFNLVVVFEEALDNSDQKLERAVAESTFHHFCDYNWNLSVRCPSFVSEPPGNTIAQEL